MDVIFRTEDLLTVVGCGGVTLLVLQFLVKPVLAALRERPFVIVWYGVLLNACALVVSVGAALLAQAALGIDYASGLQAFLTGLGGMAVAVTSYETVKNVFQLAQRR